MARLDFPSSPTFNQRYPDPAVPGIPVYTWDLEKWVASGPVGSPPQAPFDAMAYSGMQINGGMEVSQELGVAGRSTTGYICDGWLMDAAGPAISSSQQNTSIVPGFPSHLLTGVTTAKPSLSAGDYAEVFQMIEGYRIAKLAWGTANAQPITISFWSKHSRTGIYSIAVGNSGVRSYAVTYTQAVSNVAQYNTITIPGDASGTWVTNYATGIILQFCISSGTTRIAPSANTWLAGNYMAAPGQVNATTTTSDTFIITGVTVLPGTQAPTAAQSPNIMRPYDQELATCMRYWENIGPMDFCEYTLAGYGIYQPAHSFKVRKRAAPTTTIAWGSATNSGAPSWSSVSVNGVSLTYSALAAGNAILTGVTGIADARL